LNRVNKVLVEERRVNEGEGKGFREENGSNAG